MPNNTVSRKVIDSLLPPGPIWEYKEGGDLDKLLDGIADNYEQLLEDLQQLSDVRDPYNTTILDDLEREYGIIKNSNLTDDVRRQQIATIKYNSKIYGSEDDLQNALDMAGFDLQVHQNDPAVDPAIILDQLFNMVADGDNAYAGRDDAFASRIGGELIVNGDIYEQRTLYLAEADGSNSYAGNSEMVAGRFDETERSAIMYDIPTDPNSWPFVFFVGGGPLQLLLQDSGSLV